ncbi:MAG: glycoside hydrolase family 2 TIM barrel-domain containing protein [Bacteroidota bacterium]
MKPVLPVIKGISAAAILFFLMTACISRPEDISQPGILFNDNWSFVMDSAEVPGALDSLVSSDWVNVSLPHSPRIEPLVVNDQWQGICWYRKAFSFRPEWEGRALFLRFEGAMNVAEVWVNGRMKIRHEGGYLPFVTEISQDLYHDRENILLVRLDNRDNPVTGPKPLHLLDFNTYGGIYRDVKLLVKNRAYITDEQYENMVAGGGLFVTFPKVGKDSSLLAVSTHVRNGSAWPMKIQLRQQLVDNGRVLAEETSEQDFEAGVACTLSQELLLRDAELWSPGNPKVYELVTTVQAGDTLLDRRTTRFGIRKFEFRDNRLLINGEETFLRGVNRHQEYPFIGYALSDNADYRDARLIKEAGFDLVRTSHYPQSEAFLSACDELGIVVVDAILGWQYYSGDRAFHQNVFASARDLIRRDRNHPSVLAWEVSLNESWMPEPFIDSLVAIAKQEYPVENSFAAGWQTYGYDIYIQARQHRLGHESEIPDKPYMVSEYGDWEYFAMNAGLNQEKWLDLLPTERSSRQLPGAGEKRLLQQAMNIQEAHNDNLGTIAFADAYWLMFDYNRGYAPDLESSGLMGIFRQPKFSYYFFRTQRDAGEMVAGRAVGPEVFIAAFFNDTVSRDVRIFTNCDEVELFEDDRSLGVRKPVRDRSSDRLRHPPVVFEDVPFTGNVLRAVGRLQDGRETEFLLFREAMPEKISLSAGFSGKPLMAGCNDVLFIYARMEDSNSTTVSNCLLPVHFRISGDAEIIGDSLVVPEAGVATVLIRAGAEGGQVKVSATADGLRSGELILDVARAETLLK